MSHTESRNLHSPVSYRITQLPFLLSVLRVAPPSPIADVVYGWPQSREGANVLNALRQNLSSGLFLPASHLAYITKARRARKYGRFSLTYS